MAIENTSIGSHEIDNISTLEVLSNLSIKVAVYFASLIGYQALVECVLILEFLRFVLAQDYHFQVQIFEARAKFADVVRGDLVFELTERRGSLNGLHI